MKLGLREILFIVLLTGIPVSAWLFVFRPRNAQDAEMMRQIETKQVKLRTLNQTVSALGNLKNEIASLKKAISFFESKLPNEKEIASVLQEVWRLAEANKLAAKSIRPLERSTQNCLTSTDGPHAEQPIAMQLEGDFLGFYSFLQAMENQPRIIRIHKMMLAKPAKAPEGTMRADFVLSIFFERTDKEEQCPQKKST